MGEGVGMGMDASVCILTSVCMHVIDGKYTFKRLVRFYMIVSSYLYIAYLVYLLPMISS